MADGRRRDEWDRTSLVCAMLVNSNPYRKGKPITPDAFNPYAAKASAKPGKRALQMVGIEALQVFVKGKPPPS